MTSKQSQTKRRTRSKADSPTSTEADSSKAAENAAESRWRRTAVAAFFRAEARGFTPGRELEDWLEAERELDALEAARREQAAPPQRSAVCAPASSDEPVATPPKRATPKRSKTTRGASLQARNRGDES